MPQKPFKNDNFENSEEAGDEGKDVTSQERTRLIYFDNCNLVFNTSCTSQDTRINSQYTWVKQYSIATG